MQPLRSRQFVTAAALASIALALGACSSSHRSGGQPADQGGGSGVSRQFDEQPVLLAFDGATVLKPDQAVTLYLIADNTEYRGPAYLSLAEAQTASLRVIPAALDAPASVQLGPLPRYQGTFIGAVNVRFRVQPDDFLAASVSLRAPQFVSGIERYELRASNSRSEIRQAVYVVPEDTTYVRELILPAAALESGQRTSGRIVLSRPAPPDGVTVNLSASTTLVALPPSVHIDGGYAEAAFSIEALHTTGQTFTTIRAELNQIERQAGLWVRSDQPFLLHLDVPRYLAYNQEGTTASVRLSKPVPAGQSFTFNVGLASENSLVTVPPFVPVMAGRDTAEFTIHVQQLFSLSAVRIRANAGGAERIADALFGRDLGRPLISSVVAEEYPGNSPCYDSTRTGFGQELLSIGIDRRAPTGGFAINLFSSDTSVVPLRRTVVIPEGQLSVGTQIPIESHSAADLGRVIRITARSVDGLDEKSTYIVVANSNFYVVEFGSMGSLKTYFTPHLSLAQTPVSAGSRLEGYVTLGEVLADGSVDPHPNARDDVPVRILLSIGEYSASTDVTVLRGLGVAEFHFDLPPGNAAATATLSSYVPLSGVTSNRCTLAHSIDFPVQPGGTLRDLRSSARQVFGGAGGTLTVVLSEPAPAGGARVDLLADIPASPLHLPASVTVPAGQREASVAFSTDAAPLFHVDVPIRATYGNTVARTVTVMSEPHSVAVSFFPAEVARGETTQLRVTLDRSFPIPLSAVVEPDGAGYAGVQAPATVTIPAGTTSGTAQVATDVDAPSFASFRAQVRAASGSGSFWTHQSGSWQNLGDPISFGELRQQAAASDFGSLLAYTETVTGDVGRLRVRSFNDNEWQLVGPDALNATSTTAASDPALTWGAGLQGIAVGPVLAWSQGNGIQQNVFVARLSAQRTWEPLGTGAPLNMVPGSRAVRPVISHIDSNHFGLGWIENDRVRYRIYRNQFNDWIQADVAAGLAPPTMPATVVRLVPSGGTAYIAWLAPSYPNPIGVARWTDSGWDVLPALVVPPPDFGNPGLNHLLLITEGSGQLTAIWDQGTQPLTLLARRWDGSAWGDIETVAGPVDGTLTSIASPEGCVQPIVALAYTLPGGGSTIAIRSRSHPGSRWGTEVADDFSAATVERLSLAHDDNSNSGCRKGFISFLVRRPVGSAGFQLIARAYRQVPP